MINGIFATPISIEKFERDFTSKEYKFIEKSKINSHKNKGGNVTSNENYILNKKSFSSLKKELDKRVKDYFNNVISISNNVEPYITQSWLNYTLANQYHHKHIHFNSIVSGVLYINADKKMIKLNFLNHTTRLLNYRQKNTTYGTPTLGGFQLKPEICFYFLRH